MDTAIPFEITREGINALEADTNARIKAALHEILIGFVNTIESIESVQTTDDGEKTIVTYTTIFGEVERFTQDQFRRVFERWAADHLMEQGAEGEHFAAARTISRGEWDTTCMSVDLTSMLVLLAPSWFF